jgi:hypothetical protein
MNSVYAISVEHPMYRMLRRIDINVRLQNVLVLGHSV